MNAQKVFFLEGYAKYLAPVSSIKPFFTQLLFSNVYVLYLFHNYSSFLVVVTLNFDATLPVQYTPYNVIIAAVSFPKNDKTATTTNDIRNSQSFLFFTIILPPQTHKYSFLQRTVLYHLLKLHTQMSGACLSQI